MKKITQSLYNLVTSENFENINQKLQDSIDRNRWSVAERHEITIEELINELPDLVDVIKQNIEDSNFDSLPMNVRQSILNICTQINSHLVGIYQNQQQFPALQDQFQSLKQQIYIYRIELTARRIPRYKEKINEYRVLIDQLKDVSSVLKKAERSESEIGDQVARGTEIINELESYASSSKKNESEIVSLLKKVAELHNEVEAVSKTIREQKDSVTDILDEVKESRSDVKTAESEIKSVQKNIQLSLDQYNQVITDAEKKIAIFKADTNSIITQNQTQQTEIDKQLQKAVGVSLFSTFETRKEDLNNSLNNWLVGLAVFTVCFIGFSGWIAYDLSKEQISWFVVLVKLAISFPLIYALIFLSARYTKERRLVEEYAFKSTISLALSPYADLVKKVENDGADSKYRDFLISSIENIFSIPTDKAFGFSKIAKKDNSKIDSESLSDVLDLLEKAKKITKPEDA